MRYPMRLLRAGGDVLVSLAADGGELDAPCERAASIVASTSATYSLDNRAFFYEGNAQAGLQNGDYVRRVLKAGKNGRTADEPQGIFVVTSVHPEPHYENMAYFFLTECNARATLHRDAGDGVYTAFAADVLCYKTTTTRSDKAQNDGLLDQTIYLCYIPARFGLAKGDVLMFAGDGRQYRCESVSDGLSRFGAKAEGLDVAQLLYTATANPIGAAGEEMTVWPEVT